MIVNQDIFSALHKRDIFFIYGVCHDKNACRTTINEGVTQKMLIIRAKDIPLLSFVHINHAEHKNAVQIYYWGKQKALNMRHYVFSPILLLLPLVVSQCLCFCIPH